MKKYPLIGAFALILSLSSTGFAAEPVSAQNYRRAFTLLETGHPDDAMSVALRGGDPVLAKVIQGYAMAQPGTSYSFTEISSFITNHPDWPGIKGMVMIAEQKLPEAATVEQINTWFNDHPAIGLPAFYRSINALEAAGYDQKAAQLIKSRWIERDFSGEELIAYASRFGSILTLRDHYARLDGLLWDNQVTAARQMFRFVDPDVRALAEARIALANQLNGAETLVARVPSQWQNDAGLLYERLRWRRKNNLTDSAIEILRHAPANLGRPEAWWTERAIVIRRLIEQQNYKLAYDLAAHNGLTAGTPFVEAEFLAGWLALRFLDKPEAARDHFDNLLQSATTPISRARGSYWLARAYEAMGRREEAQESYQTAASLSTTFYGLLASTRLVADPILSAPHEPAIPASVRSAFFARDTVQAASHLYHMGLQDKARVFYKAIMDSCNQRVEFALLTELAYKLQRPDWAIQAAKAANQKNMLLAANAYPVLGIHIPSPPDPAFTHAVIRQESLFNADAGSPVGARGLMQLMPATAKNLARKMKIPYAPARLLDPAYNVRLGTTYIQEQLDAFGGSYILALAGYNAGPGRVKEWLSTYGDPRRGQIDPIDWIELIPIQETRNYVQRIMENFAIYKARLAGGKASLTILQDLRR